MNKLSNACFHSIISELIREFKEKSINEDNAFKSQVLGSRTSKSQQTRQPCNSKSSKSSKTTPHLHDVSEII